MKRAVFLILILSVTFIAAMPAAASTDFETKGSSALIMDPETGQVLYEKNPYKKMEPASITKTMVMILIQEAIEKGEIHPDDMVTISRHAQSMYGSQIFLQAGERVTVNDLLRAVAISSANDATVALAEYHSGSEEAFVRAMNRRAEELGMENTNFINSTGLPDDDHYTTAYDIALMSQEVLKFPELLEMTKVWMEYLDLPGRQAMLVNFNRLVRSYPGVDGIKTGHTTRAGYCLAATAKRDDRRLIAVLMDLDSEEEREEEMTRLLDFAFRAFQREVFLEKGDEIETVETITARNPQVSLIASDGLKPYIRRGSSDEVRTEKMIEEIEAPLEKGQIVGEIKAYQGERLLGTVEVEVKEDVERANFLVILWRRIVNFITDLLTV